MRNWRNALVLLICSLICLSAQAKKGGSSGRGDDVLGLYVTNNDPIPGQVGAGLGITLAPFLRLNGGVSYADNSSDNPNVDTGFADQMVAAMFWIMAAGLIDYDDIVEFVSENKSETTIPFTKRKVTTKSASLDWIIVPGWQVSPVIGAGWSQYRSENSFKDLEEKKDIAYYKFGFDWHHPSGFYFAFGVNHSPDLPKPIQTIGYARLGYFLF
ncbi:MAG: hypothetical protein H6624_06565 [Bdellovibrionaceae bacterium]|nr:hypothetical protein [Bdellovibrionales bacterium]MCB9083987.1 hypothetical protein [Pseudobdellovibrionaceae bacterium]